MTKNFVKIDSFEKINELSAIPVKSLLQKELEMFVNHNGLNYRDTAQDLSERLHIDFDKALDLVIESFFNTDGGFFLADIDLLCYSESFEVTLKEPKYDKVIKEVRQFLVDYDISFKFSTKDLFEYYDGHLSNSITTRVWLANKNFDPLLLFYEVGNIVYGFIINLQNQKFIEFASKNCFANYDIENVAKEYIKEYSYSYMPENLLSTYEF